MSLPRTGVDEVVAGVLLGERVPLANGVLGVGVERAPGGLGEALGGVRASAVAGMRRAPRPRPSPGPTAARRRRGARSPRGRRATPRRSRRGSAGASAGRGRRPSDRARAASRRRRGCSWRSKPCGAERVEEGEVEARDARVGEARGHRRVDRHRRRAHGERLTVALHLLADVAQGVFGAALLELVERDKVGRVEHPDLLELARRAVLGRHHVERDVGQPRDLGIRLADACRLDDDKVEARRPERPEPPRGGCSDVALCACRVANERM